MTATAVKEDIYVQKRNGRGREPLNLDKVHEMVEAATRGLGSVSASQVEMKSGLQFYDGIETMDIQQILIKSANDLISLENYNLHFVNSEIRLPF